MEVPGPPTGVTAVADIDLAARVSFTPPDDAGTSPITGYRITSDPDGLTVDISDPDTTSAIVSGLTAGTEYTFTVRAESNAGEGPESDPSEPVAAVAGLPAPEVGVCGRDGRTHIAITPVEGATSYNLYFSTEPGVSKLDGTKLAGVGTPYEHDALENATYYYVAEAVAGDGVVSLDSDEASTEVGPGLRDVYFAASFSTNFPRVEITDCPSIREDGYQGPDRLIEGLATGIEDSGIAGITVDVEKDTLYLADVGNASIRVWPNASTVDGNTAPARVLTGANTLLAAPKGMVIEPQTDRLYVADDGADELLVFANAATADGNVTPAAQVTGLARPFQIALDPDGDILYIATTGGVQVVDNASTLSGTVSADAVVARTIEVGISSLGVAFDPENDLLYVGSRETDGAVYVVENPATADGAVMPARTLTSNAGGLFNVMTVQILGDVLYTFNDSATRLHVWEDAGALDGVVAPSRELLLELSSGGAFFVVE